MPEALSADADCRSETRSARCRSLAVANPDLYINLADMIAGTMTARRQVAKTTQDQFAQLAKAAGHPASRPVAVDQDTKGSIRTSAHIRTPPHRWQRPPHRARRAATAPRASGRHRSSRPPAAFLRARLRHDGRVLLRADALQPHLRLHRLVELQDRDQLRSGCDNFAQRPRQRVLLRALRITLIYAVLVAIFQNLFGFGLACCSKRDTRSTASPGPCSSSRC